MRKFVTNSKSLQTQINRDEGQHGADLASVATEETYAKSTLGTHEMVHPGEQKILGIRWDVDTDCLLINTQDITLLATELQPTKRNIVSTVDRFYDIYHGLSDTSCDSFQGAIPTSLPGQGGLGSAPEW